MFYNWSMNKIITKYETELYILKQQEFVDGLDAQLILYDKTIAVCTKLSDAIKIQKKNKNVYLFTIGK